MVIGHPLGARHARVEIFRIEIAVVDNVPFGEQPLDDQPVQAGIVTCFDGMGVEDQDLHALHQPAFCRPLKRNGLPVR